MSAAKTGTPLEPLLKKIMVAGEPFHQRVAYGGRGDSHWAQVLCPSCGAWLKTQPDKSEKADSGYTYFWTCLNCGVVRYRDESSPPESWSIDPETTEQVPGSFPPLAVWDPYAWLDGSGLPTVDIALARKGWSSLAAFALTAGDPAIGRSAVLDAQAKAQHPSEPLIKAVRIELKADRLGSRILRGPNRLGSQVLEGPRLWERADDFMREAAKTVEHDAWYGAIVSYRITFADGYAFHSSAEQFRDEPASLSLSIRRRRMDKYLNNLSGQPEAIKDFTDGHRAFLSRYKLGPGRHERKMVAEDMFAATQTLEKIGKFLEIRRNRLRDAAQVHRFENAPEPIRVGAAVLKLAAAESVCEALERTDARKFDRANQAVVRLDRLGSYVPDFEIRDHSTLQERLKNTGAVINRYEMMHTADNSNELRSDEARLAKAMSAWRAQLDASRHTSPAIRARNLSKK
jgi:hypothetical protein